MPEGDQGSGRLRARISDERGRRARADGLGPWLARVAPARARGIVSVALVSDRRIRALNRSYLRKDYATDVLSFPASDSSTSTRYSLIPGTGGGHFLGDIVIARGVARRQARAAGHAEGTELRILALHGLLHLLGDDHERDKGRMLRVERRLRRKGGLREGLIERAQGRPVRPRARR
jgi:probable rRNA maturation factor